MGSLYIEGYKPRSNVQEALRSTVQAERQSNYDLDSLMLKVIDASDFEPTDYVLAEESAPVVEVPQGALHKPFVGRIDFPRIEARKRGLGLAGEESTVKFEQRRLHSLGRKDLLRGALEESCVLRPYDYSAVPRSS